jgi:hypothetical protein
VKAHALKPVPRRDREEVFAKTKLLRGTNIYVTEDLSRKARENRHELTRYMREARDPLGDEAEA